MEYVVIAVLVSGLGYLLYTRYKKSKNRLKGGGPGDDSTIDQH